MKIVAIGSMPLDFEISCFNTLKKLTTDGHSVSLIIPRDKYWNEKQIKTDLKQKLKISNIHYIENFDYSRVTQLNVKLINSIIEKIKPSLTIIPFIGNSNKMKKILAKSALLACRKVETILMYETNKNNSFFPTVYNVINKKTISKNASRKSGSLQYNYANKSGIQKPVEAFESQRMVLLQNDLF